MIQPTIQYNKQVYVNHMNLNESVTTRFGPAYRVDREVQRTLYEHLLDSLSILLFTCFIVTYVI